MQLFGSKLGTIAWLVIGTGTIALAVANENRVTGVIAIGWITLAAFSYIAYRKES